MGALKRLTQRLKLSSFISALGGGITLPRKLNPTVTARKLQEITAEAVVQGAPPLSRPVPKVVDDSKAGVFFRMIEGQLTQVNQDGPPTDITWGGDHDVDEDSALGTLIGSPLTATAEGDDPITFTIPDETSKFLIIGSSVAVGGVLDYETLTEHTITIRATNASGFFEKDFLVTINDVVEEQDPGEEEPEEEIIVEVVDDGGFAVPPVVTNVDGGVKIHGKKNNSSSAKLIVDLGVPTMYTEYIIHYTTDFSLLGNDGHEALVGFGARNGNDFHIYGLRGDGSPTAVDVYEVSGTPPNGWTQTSGFTEQNGGAAAHGTQAGAWQRVIVNANGDISFYTSPDGTTWVEEVATEDATPITNIISGATQFGIAVVLQADDNGPFSVFIDHLEINTFPGELVTFTGIWSFHKAHTVAWEGQTLFTTATGKVNSLKDQSGNARNLDQSTAARRPSPGTGGLLGEAAGVFDSVNNTYLDSAAGDPISDFIDNNAGYILVATIPTTIDSVQAIATPYENDTLITETTGRFGIMFTAVNGYDQAIYNHYDGTHDAVAGAAVLEGQLLVMEWWHTGGVLTGRINGNDDTLVTVNSGNMDVLTGLLRLGGKYDGNANAAYDGKIFDILIADAVPSSTQRNNLVNAVFASIQGQWRAKARLSQQYVEVITSGSNPKARLDQQYTEVISSGSDPKARLDQQYTEIITSGSDPKARLDQQYVEIIHNRVTGVAQFATFRAAGGSTLATNAVKNP